MEDEDNDNEDDNEDDEEEDDEEDDAEGSEVSVVAMTKASGMKLTPHGAHPLEEACK